MQVTMPMDKWPSKHASEPPAGAAGELMDLVRGIVARLAGPLGEDSAEPVAALKGPSEHVLFDLDVDGERYLLIKIVPQERCGAVLSPREREIVRMVAHGHPNKVIAAVLNISAWTVCTHLRRIFAKLGVSSRAAMVAKAAESGLVLEGTAPGMRVPRTHA
jgi:DNA-binding CsgD family transcriptional regulator